ncbi:MAG: translocation/assembly module TamB domain-containing protein [Bacteroidales bacterium]|nr:translocation/assembly module TamB domain-containing protein [Bacteroidales bacterium]
MQTYFADRALKTLSEKLDGDIYVEKIHLKPFTTLVLKNVSIVDRNPASDKIDSTNVKVDTFFRAEYIIAQFSLEGLFSDEGFHLDKAVVQNAQMNLVIEDKVDIGDGDVTTDNLSRIFRIVPKKNPKKSEKEIFRIRKVEIRNMGFAMKNYVRGRHIYGEEGIDWNDLDVSSIYLNAKDLKFKGGIMSGEAKSLKFKEKSGYSVDEMSGIAKVGRGRTIIDDLRIDDPWSDVHLPLFMMSYKNVKAFKDFIGLVKLDGDIAESSLNFKTISYFAPKLMGNDLDIKVSGSMSGCIDDFTFTNIRINSTDGVFNGNASGRMAGLPDINNTYLEARLDDFVFTTHGLGNFISEWMMGKGSLDLSKFASGTRFSLNARGKGPMNALDLDATVTSVLGKVDAEVLLSDIVRSGSSIGIAGKVETEDLNIGRFIGSDMVGPTTLKTTMSAKLGSDDIPTEMKIDTLKIDRLQANGYDYSNITALGKITSNGFDGSIVCNDPNLNFLLQGAFALSSKTRNARYKFFTNIGHADLHALNLDKRGVSRITLRASADFTKANTGDMRGKIDIGDIGLQNSLGKYDIGNISLHSYSSDSTYVIRLDSRFANGRYSGSSPITTFIKDLRNITLKKEIPALFRDSTYVWNGNSYGIDFKFHNSMDILSFIMPGLYIDEGTQFHASLDKNGKFDARLNSNRLAFKTNYLKNISAVLDNHDDELDGQLECSEVKLTSFSLKDSNLQIHGDDNMLGVRFGYDNQSEKANRGELIMRSTFARDTDGLGIGIEFLPSSIFINDKEWDLQQSHITLKGDEADVRNFAAISGNEKIILEGKVSKDNPDTLELNLERFDISIANNIIRREMGIRGMVTGTVQMTSPMKDKGILLDLISDSTYFAAAPLGTLHIGSKWNEVDENFNILVRNELDGKNNIYAYGSLKPDVGLLDITAELDKFSISYAHPVLADVFSEMKGTVSGQIDVSGPVSNLEISSRGTRLEDGLLKIDYTNVPYYAEGPFHLDETGAYFDGISIRDAYRGTGTVNGSINWDHFRNMRFNTSISVNEIEGINLTEDSNEGFYGNIFGTGNVSITGPSNAILLSIDAVTAGDGQLHIPLSTAATGKVTNLLRFKEKERNERIDPYEVMMNRMKEQTNSSSDLIVKLRVNARPEVQAFIEIDKASGNVLSGYGSGLIELEAGTDLFNINGDYILSGGSYRFVAMNLVTRDFQIQDGSSIRFNGDIMNSTLDINAIYRTKASISTLLSDESSVSNKRNVDCGISITGKLSNPELGFSIDIPDLNPMIKSRVESALSADDKIQKQFLSLILSNSFLPDEQSGIANNTTLLYSNVTEALANQLNNIFHKLDIPLDLGLNYQPNESGNDLFDVAVSTQLFNNRVVVNGNIGNKQYSTSGTQNEVVGDLDIEIKINRSGAFRLNLFSHSADQFSNYLDNSQRNGVGLMYQTEFNSFGRFLRNIFSSKAKRQEAKMQEEQNMLQSKRVILQIEAPEEKKKNKD